MLTRHTHRQAPFAALHARATRAATLAISAISATLLAPDATAQLLPPVVREWKINTTGATGYGGILADVQSVQYSANYVYVKSTNIPSYSIGPWPGNPNTPTNQNWTFKLTRTPVANGGTLTATPLGHIGVFTNGMTCYNASDAMSYNNQGIWHQNAVIVEGPSFDTCLGHPSPGKEYHNHQRLPCLNSESASLHSKIIGYAFDGFPIYGPYGYANSDGSGGVARMTSSYQKRNITLRTTLPDGTVLPPSQYGPPVSAQYPLGYYIEDFEFISGLGLLDTHNGRLCVTPDYPNGIYAYFTTVDAAGASAYPYIIGPTYYGVVTAGNTGPGGGHNTISESVTTFCCTPCDADMTGDRVVDGADLGLLLSEWGMMGGAGDLNRDGVVDGGDLAIILGSWGACQ